MKTMLILSTVILITGCAAWHSLVVHPIEKLHEIHQNQEQMESYQKTNHVQ